VGVGVDGLDCFDFDTLYLTRKRLIESKVYKVMHRVSYRVMHSSTAAQQHSSTAAQRINFHQVMKLYTVKVMHRQSYAQAKLCTGKVMHR